MSQCARETNSRVACRNVAKLYYEAVSMYGSKKLTAEVLEASLNDLAAVGSDIDVDEVAT